MQSYRSFALALVLAVAPIMAETETSVHDQQQSETSVQPKSFTQKCYAYRYHIIGAGAVLAAAVIAYTWYCKKAPVKAPFDLANLTDKQAVDLAEKMTAGMSLPKEADVVVSAPTEVKSAAQAPQEATLPDQNAGANLSDTLVAWKDVVVAWFQKKKTAIAADWQNVPNSSLEKILHYVKPLSTENK